jgi:hypothetical protein
MGKMHIYCLLKQVVHIITTRLSWVKIKVKSFSTEDVAEPCRLRDVGGSVMI